MSEKKTRLPSRRKQDWRIASMQRLEDYIQKRKGRRITAVVYWPPTPPNMPFQRRRKCIFHWRGRTWLTIGDRVKIPRYSRWLMHRKRVTCELHNSYFRLMTIKHAIPKTAEVTHSNGQLWGDIEWASELLYNSVKTGVS